MKPPDESFLLDRIDEIIENDGIATTSCPPGPSSPRITHTIGMVGHGFPELAIVGVAPDAAERALKAIAMAVLAADAPLTAGSVVESSGTPYRVAATPIPDALISLAVRYHGRADIPRRQMLVPDAVGRHPGDPRCDPRVAALQSTEPRARR